MFTERWVTEIVILLFLGIVRLFRGTVLAKLGSLKNIPIRELEKERKLKRVIETNIN